MITFSSRCGSESRREPKREGVVPYRNRSNVGPTIAHPDPAAITIRQGLRLHICPPAPMYDDFVRLVERGGGYFLDSVRGRFWLGLRVAKHGEAFCRGRIRHW